MYIEMSMYVYVYIYIYIYIHTYTFISLGSRSRLIRSFSGADGSSGRGASFPSRTPVDPASAPPGQAARVLPDRGAAARGRRGAVP